jgi:hypothetical protein
MASCRSTPDLKPAKQPERYGLPPANDERYSRPPDYPRNRFEEDLLQPKLDGDPSPTLGRPGAGAGMGRPY